MQIGDSHQRWNMIVGAAVFATISHLLPDCDLADGLLLGQRGIHSDLLQPRAYPHPPGTPFYVIVGRLFAMLPFHEKALGVNLMSALTGALASLFLYLITVRILVAVAGPAEDRGGSR